MIQVTRTELGKNKYRLEIEVDALSVNNAYEQAYRALKQKVNLPGFRKGKVPKDVLQGVVDQREFQQLIYDALVPDAYREALRQEKLEPIEAPQVRVIQLEENQPLKFEVTIVASPKVELGEYKGIEVEVPSAEVSEEEIEAQLERIRQERANFEKISLKELEQGDMVRGAIKATLDGKEIAELSREETILALGQPGVAGINFDDMLVGKHVGETAHGKYTVPESYDNAELAGKDVDFAFEIKEAYQRSLPELNDEFAASLGDPNVSDMASLKEQLSQAMRRQKEEVQQNALRTDVVAKVVEEAQVEVPEAMVVRETLRLADDLLRSLERERMSLTDYLESKQVQAEGLFNELAEAARFRVKRSLVLDAIAEKENIQAADEDLEEHIKALAAERGVKDWRMKEILREEGRYEALRYAVTQQKVVDFLAEQAIKKYIGEETAEAAEGEVSEAGAESEASEAEGES